MRIRLLTAARSLEVRSQFLLLCLVISIAGYCPVSEATESLLSAAASQSGYTLIDLGTMGGRSSRGLALNNNGWVTGSWWNTRKKRSQAFIFDSSGIRDIGSLGGISTKGKAINDSGLVVGNGKTTDGKWAAFLYDGDVLKRLEVEGASHSWATAINNNSDIVGYLDLGTRDYAAFLYRNGRLIDLGTLGGNTWAEDISDSGIITGSSVEGESAVTAFLWREGTMTSLGKMGGRSTKGISVTEEGVASGSVRHDDGRGPFFIADSSSSKLVQAPGGRGATPYAINNSGYVVGEMGHPDIDDAVGFLYDGERIHFLCDVLNCEVHGWSRLFVLDINDHGDMTGSVKVSDQSHAFLALKNSEHSKEEIDRIVALANGGSREDPLEHKLEEFQSSFPLASTGNARIFLSPENNDVGTWLRGQCVEWAKILFSQASSETLVGKVIGNAIDLYDFLCADHQCTVNRYKPRTGAMVLWTSDVAGHVGVVTKIDGKRILVSEANWGPVTEDPAVWGLADAAEAKKEFVTVNYGRFEERWFELSSLSRPSGNSTFEFAGYIYPKAEHEQ